MVKTADLVRRLRRGGFVFVKHGKKHDLYANEATGKRVWVWRHNRDVPTGTYLQILADAGLGDE